MQDRGASAGSLTERGKGQSASAGPSRSGWAADDLIPALSRRVAELEERLAAIQADLKAERGRLATYADSDHSLNEAAADSYRSADAILQRARAEANETLTAAVDERRMLLDEVERLRGEREELQNEIASLGRGERVAVPEPVQVKAPQAFDLQTAIADEMRTLLVEILADFRSRVAAQPPAVEHNSVQPAIVADVVTDSLEQSLETIVEDAETVASPADLTGKATPIDAVEFIVEHVDELIRPAPEVPA